MTFSCCLQRTLEDACVFFISAGLLIAWLNFTAALGSGIAVNSVDMYRIAVGVGLLAFDGESLA